jgi:hypothetical protein
MDPLPVHGHYTPLGNIIHEYIMKQVWFFYSNVIYKIMECFVRGEAMLSEMTRPCIKLKKVMVNNVPIYPPYN